MQVSSNVLEKISGPTWEPVREKFLALCETLLSVSPDARTELTTTYVKFTITGELSSPVYAVVWVKNSKKWVVGLALPATFESPDLGPAPPQRTYAGLTKYFELTPEIPLPGPLAEWARLSYAEITAPLS